MRRLVLRWAWAAVRHALDLRALANIALPTLASCVLTLGSHLQGLAAGKLPLKGCTGLFAAV